MGTKASAPPANNERRQQCVFKVFVIGESATGRTAILERCIHNDFHEHYRPTIGVDFRIKVIRINDDITIKIQFWNCSGGERFQNITRAYYRGADGCIIVYDVTRPSTFDTVSKWKSDFDSNVQVSGGSPVPCILLANKCDLAKDDLFNNAEQMDMYSREKGFLKWFETSAKENVNIEIAIRYLTDEMVKNDDELHQADLRIKLDDHSSQPAVKNRGCCWN